MRRKLGDIIPSWLDQIIFEWVRRRSQQTAGPAASIRQALKPADYLSFYATRFDTVEDSTFYGTPSVSTVKAWNAKTPPGFIFAAKVPQVITHEKVLADCDVEFKQFVETMDNLGEKLGPLLFQLGYLNKSAFGGWPTLYKFFFLTAYRVVMVPLQNVSAGLLV